MNIRTGSWFGYALLLAITAAAAGEESTTIAFGSCADDDKPDHPIWDAIYDVKPEIFLMLGDNVYADTSEFIRTRDPELIKAEYEKLARSSKFKRLRQYSSVFATWDDHDYGLNDAGGEFAQKRASEQIFLDFFDVPTDAPERLRPGIYSVKYVEKYGKRIQIILLDTRYFRSALLQGQGSCKYAENTSQSATILGNDQWEWLEQELQQPADFRILASSLQFLNDEHCWERWGAFPKERKRLLAVLRNNAVKNIVVVSGDRHLGEISRYASAAEEEGNFPFYEVTSSPLSARSGFGEGDPNRFRIGRDNVRVANFGLIKVDWRINTVDLSLVGSDGTVLETTSFYLQ